MIPLFCLGRCGVTDGCPEAMAPRGRREMIGGKRRPEVAKVRPLARTRLNSAERWHSRSRTLKQLIMALIACRAGQKPRKGALDPRL